MTPSLRTDSSQPAPASRPGQWLRIFILPALLMGLVYVTAGFYYETNDDTVIKLILQGKAADVNASSLRIYMPGWAPLLKPLYAWAPGFAWYDALMVLLMYVALVASFYALERLWPRSPQQGLGLAVLEVLYFGVTMPLHLIQNNFTRPAILLGAAAVALLTIPIEPNRPFLKHWAVAGLLFAMGWGIRPVGAEVGALLLAPLVLLLLTPKRAVLAGVYLAALTGLLMLANTLSLDADDKRYVAMQNRRTTILDYERAKVVPQTAADSIAANLLEWGAGPYDTNLLNDEFFQRCIQPVSLSEKSKSAVVTLGIIRQDIKQWTMGTLGLVGLGAVLVFWAWRRGQLAGRNRQLLAYVLYQLFFWAVYVGVAVWFHEVPRVAQPLLSVYGLANLILLGGVLRVSLLPLPTGPGSALLRWACLGLVAGCALLSVERGWRLHLTEQLQEQRHDAYLRQLHAKAANTVIVEAGLNEATANLKFFKDYGFTDYTRFITLLNWHKFDPGQERALYTLTGQTDPAAALLTLGKRPQTQVTWLLMPKFVTNVTNYLNLRLRRPADNQLRFEPLPGQLPLDYGPQRYVLVAETTGSTPE